MVLRGLEVVVLLAHVAVAADERRLFLAGLARIEEIGALAGLDVLRAGSVAGLAAGVVLGHRDLLRRRVRRVVRDQPVAGRVAGRALRLPVVLLPVVLPLLVDAVPLLVHELQVAGGRVLDEVALLPERADDELDVLELVRLAVDVALRRAGAALGVLRPVGRRRSLSRPSLSVRIIFEWSVSFQVRYSAWWHFWHASEPTNPSAVGPPGPVTQPAVTAPSAATAATAIQPSVVFVIESNSPMERKASLARRFMLRGSSAVRPSFIRRILCAVIRISLQRAALSAA